MKTLVVRIENDSTLKLLSTLVKELGLNSTVLTDKRKEDIALIRAIDEGMKSEILPVSSAYKILDNIL